MTNPVDRLFDFIVREREEWRRTARVVRLGLSGLVKSQIPRMAAALSYRTIFSLIPVLVVGASVMGQFLSDDELESQINTLIAYIGLDTIALDESEPETGSDLGSDLGAGLDPGGVTDAEQRALAARHGVEDPGGLDAVDPTRLDDWITGLVERVTSLPFSQIGFIGLLVLVYGAIAMLVELERSFNQIYGVSNGRAWTKRITTYWTTITLGLVFLLATFSVGDRVGAWVASIGKTSEEAQGWIAGGIVDFAVSVTINMVLLVFAYMTVPNARVHVRPALAGAAIAGLGWEIGKSAFTAYVSNAVDNLQQLYGVLALLPLFLFWVYITWIIVLFGLQVAYSLQHFGSWSEERRAEESGFVDPGLGVRFAVLLAEAFEGGEALSADELAGRCGVPGGVASRMLGVLARAGLVRATTDGDDSGYVLARPAGAVMVGEVLTAVRRGRAGGEEGGASLIDARLDRSVEGVPLSELVAGGGIDA